MSDTAPQQQGSKPSGPWSGQSEMVRLYAAPLYRYCRRRLGDAHLAEDAVQETFLRVCRGTSQGDPRDPAAWLFGVARRCCQELARRRRRLTVVGGDVTVADPATVEAADPLPAPLDEALERLDDGERSLVYLKHTEGLTCREIAEATGRPLGTVTSALTRAYAKLRAAMRNISE